MIGQFSLKGKAPTKNVGFEYFPFPYEIQPKLHIMNN